MFDVNHGFAFTVHDSARIPAALAAHRGREGLCVSVWLQRVTKMIKAHSSLPGGWHLVPAGHKLQHRGVQGDWLLRRSRVCTNSFSLWLKGLAAMWLFLICFCVMSQNQRIC